MAAKIRNSTELKFVQNQFKRLRSMKNMAQVLKQEEHQLALMATKPLYFQFEVPKKNGDFRAIEAPNHELKRIQRELNFYLQACYLEYRPSASHGFIVTVGREMNPIGIKTNALSHKDAAIMVNVDFEDFFHQISIKRVQSLVRNYFPSFDDELVHWISEITTFNGRLPMGAPTSPVLSNFHCIAFDQDVSIRAKANGWVYTRYVDDISISSVSSESLEQLESFMKMLCAEYELKLNNSKTALFGPNQMKEITGLVIDDPISIQTSFYAELKKDIERLKSISEAEALTGVYSAHLKEALTSAIEGAINFIADIEGADSEEYLNYLQLFNQAKLVQEVLYLKRWQSFSYQ